MKPELITDILDLHHHDWRTDDELAAAKAAGMKALLHKATQGKDWRDPKFASAMAAAQDLGLLRGAYHFASNSADGAVQADWFMERVALAVGTVANDVLLALDWENNPDTTSGVMSVENARRFVERVHTVTGRWPLVYSFTHFLKGKLPGRDDVLGQCPLWQSQFGERPKAPASPTWREIALWQYTNGADGPRDKTLYPRRTGGFAKTGQDRSAFFGTADELAAWWASAGR